MTLPPAFTYKDLQQTLLSYTRNSACEYSYATTTPLLSDIPRQFEIELTLRDNKPVNIPKVSSMMDTIKELLEGMGYGLFNLVKTPTKDRVKGYFVASPTLSQAVTEHKGEYSLLLFLASLRQKGRASHQKQNLRDITRYISGGNLDNTAKNYYCSWFESHLLNQIEEACSSIEDIPLWFMRYLLSCNSPSEIRQLERGVIESLLNEHSVFALRNKNFTHPKSPYHQFIKSHT